MGCFERPLCAHCRRSDAVIELQVTAMFIYNTSVMNKQPLLRALHKTALPFPAPQPPKRVSHIPPEEPLYNQTTCKIVSCYPDVYACFSTSSILPITLISLPRSILAV
jgi:hypothetical protein